MTRSPSTRTSNNGAIEESMADTQKAPSRETEEALIQRAQDALNQCNWVIGECAATWTERYAKGRTDADFGSRIGLSGDQVYQRRRVWETFSDVYTEYSQLKWSHFYAALNWDDAAECLQWADEMKATIAEMKAWRRAQRGEDLTEQSDDQDQMAESTVEYLSAKAGFVRDPDEYDEDRTANGSRRSGERPPWEDSESSATVSTAARETEGAYAPFGEGARGNAPTAVADKPKPSTEQTFLRLTSALERCDKVLTPDVLDHFNDVSPKTRKRFLTALRNLSSKTAGLK
ncbi:MAG: hypothetical protein R3B91_22205 [Planctomycetaceae bacterium]